MASVVSDPLIDRRGKAHHLRRNVIDQDSSVNATAIQIMQKRFGGATVFFNLRKVWSLLLHQFERMRLEKLGGLDMYVAVGDQAKFSIVKKARAQSYAQYNGIFGSTVRAQPSMPPRIDWTFSKPCCRSQFVTVSERTP